MWPTIDRMETIDWTAITGALLGGIGLFLLGMHLMTEGMKLAAGEALEDLLEEWTSTRLRGLAAGSLITALVQSSSAVTVAAIGFVNAGLLTLRNALWVIFGSNVGTTMNAWLVAALGFSFKIDAFALPIVGIGTVLLLAARGLRLKALGQALAGFGLLFLGIDALQQGFARFGSSVNIGDHVMPGMTGYLLLVLIGILMTVLMQASGAVIAIVITAAQGGLIGIEAACAMVIGTNIGTTATAVLSAIGATANARRVAAGHVLFNLITGAVALLLLVPLVQLVGWLQPDGATTGAGPAMVVALFHTIFNLLGVALMVPLDPWLLRTLAHRFRSQHEDQARPLYLDTNTLSVPDLALRALRRELERVQNLAADCLALACDPHLKDERILRQSEALQTLITAIRGFTRRLTAQRLPAGLVDELADELRVLQYHETVAQLAREVGALHDSLPALPAGERAGLYDTFANSAMQAIHASDPLRPDHDLAEVERTLNQAEADYARIKEALLMAGADAELDVRAMQERLRQISMLRRGMQQLAKGARFLQRLEQALPLDEANAVTDGQRD